jgi:hypothetical protein
MYTVEHLDYSLLLSTIFLCSMNVIVSYSRVKIYGENTNPLVHVSRSSTLALQNTLRFVQMVLQDLISKIHLVKFYWLPAKMFLVPILCICSV